MENEIKEQKKPKKFKIGIFFKIVINQSFNKRCKKTQKAKKSKIKKME